PPEPPLPPERPPPPPEPVWVSLSVEQARGITHSAPASATVRSAASRDAGWRASGVKPCGNLAARDIGLAVSGLKDFSHGPLADTSQHNLDVNERPHLPNVSERLHSQDANERLQLDDVNERLQTTRMRVHT